MSRLSACASILLPLPILLAAQGPASPPQKAEVPEARGSAEIAKLPAPKAGTVRLFVVRHGESVGNASRDDPNLTDAEKDKLTERGKEEAAAAGVVLAKLGVKKLFHSPAERAKETATLAAAAFEKASRPALAEARAFAPLEMGRSPRFGTPASHLLVAAWRDGEDPRFEGGESLADLAARCAKGVDALRRAAVEAKGPVAVVAHGEVLAAWLLAFDGERMPKTLVSKRLANTAIGVFDVGPKGALTCLGLFEPESPAASKPARSAR